MSTKMKHAPQGSVVLCVALLCALLSVVSTQSINTTVQTSSGWVQGITYTTHKAWLGIPYAQAPVGALRWQSPQAKQPWDGVLETTSFGHACTQVKGDDLSEDCLFINVWTPIYPSTKGLLPVYLWVHGGGFVEGDGNIDGRYISGNDSVFVSINYRLGTLGFYATQQLLDMYGTTGFYGIQDQRFAMVWVQKNIASFGGDPTKVTIGGESAGGNSMCIHLATPRSAGLFRSVIMESGLCGVWQFAPGMNTSIQVTKNAGCSGSADELACMMALNGTEAFAAYKPPVGFVYYPTLHPYEITEYPLSLIQQGNYNKVPILTGTNLDEGAAWECYLGNITVAQYSSELETLFGASLASLVFQEYPPANYSSPLAALIDVASDIYIKCMTDYVILAMSTTNPDIKNYLYSFEHTPSYITNPCLGATHASELGFLFGASGLTPQEIELSQIMRSLWTSFIATGVPSISPSNMDPIAWPVFGIQQLCAAVLVLVPFALSLSFLHFSRIAFLAFLAFLVALLACLALLRVSNLCTAYSFACIVSWALIVERSQQPTIHCFRSANATRNAIPTAVLQILGTTPARPRHPTMSV